MNLNVSIPLRTGLGFEQEKMARILAILKVSIPLRTGLGFEPPRSGVSSKAKRSQSPYERVSDSNRRQVLGGFIEEGLNPLTNGSRIRTPR